ncbi:uncharacterized protein EI90DRAFT_2969410 [Cantharellus anzutake]|uniref:uncharacterized protein n=1 Tax=Cantharellus anzutake TaxID=1750568 RepID=UPI0019046557|nr:uncharacterized protein EI90DRAFT_2969410 [Cantharellus anzutake]KAF8335818.1 hypothetical protein EI90DRAFT_2969410 [Cantharellus anzutake]
MAPLNVSIKHAGKAYPIELDPEESPSVFKHAIYSVTGVPPERMKVMIKGGYLKDDTDWKKVAPKEGQTFMVIGAAGELPKPPTEKIVFLEDMTDAQLADALKMPVGLKNLGNTCYMNATVQVLRGIPELRPALQNYSLQGGTANHKLVNAMKELFQGMKSTTEGFPPIQFLVLLREVQPQFAEVRNGHYAQQDADECWVELLNSMSNASLQGLTSDNESSSQKRFVDQYLAGEMTTTFKCDEAPDEPPTILKERILKLDCPITISTNYLQAGISDALDQKIEKTSPTLGREAVYTQTSRLSRLPANLTVHMVRFYWRRDINKKAKIMRKVKFPYDLDVIDIVTPELKAKMLPLSTKLKEIEKERDERKKTRRKTKAKAQEDAAIAAVTSTQSPVTGTAPPASPTVAVGGSTGPEVTMEGSGPSGPSGSAPLPPGVQEDEGIIRAREVETLRSLVDPDLESDVGCSPHGLYELVGIVTHKGASADGGHYIGWVKRDAIEEPSPTAKPEDKYDATTDEWYKFDDDKVSVVKQDKITTLDGGGEDSTAYILLYRSKSLA